MRELILVEADELPAKQVYGRDIDKKKYKQLLGIEQGHVYWDATDGLHPNAFAAVAGSISDNHNLYLYLPKNYPNGDPDHWRLLDYGRPIELAKPYFNQRLHRLLSEQLTTIESRQNSTVAFKKKPQVILGKRGRGKSTWLAHKINWLLHLTPNYKPNILLVTTFAAHRHKIISLIDTDTTITTLPPDEACRLLPSADYLIVDEAANIPTQQLLTLTHHYPAFSLATSEDGYEGSGRFFSLQTLPTLKEQNPALQVNTLHDGQRFAAQDDLELRIEQLFYPPANLPNSIQQNHLLNIEEISQQRLAQDESLLALIYQLLFQGHYKTQPSDLKRLLDLPDQHLFVGFINEKPVAVIHLLIEQPLDKVLAQAVVKNTRRPQGRLLMQQLLLHTQRVDYAHTPIARIQRIVTQLPYRRQGLASQLIDYAAARLPHQLGVSYGATPALDSFWASQGFSTVFKSTTRNARNGRYNVIRLQKI